MASLLTNAKLGNTGVSGLIKSAATLQNEINTYQDALQAQTYAMSAKTTNDLAAYQSFLSGRITQLQSTGSVTDATKAITLENTLTSAIKANGSADIQRENIQIMSGNATLTDKYNAIVSQYSRAVGIGDMSLAQSLMSQAYSVSQSIQYQNQEAASAASTLRAAGSSSAVTYQSEVITNLDNGLKDLNNAAKGMSENAFNAYAKQYVQANAATFKALGVALPSGAQPNYFDIVAGVQGAEYNALVLKAQAEAPINPQTAQDYAYQAQFLNDGTTKIKTLGGSLTLQQVQQAASDPSMFAYDSSTGTYKMTTQTGWQYNAQGELQPTYSGYVSTGVADKFYFLTPNETKAMAKLGLQFTMNTTGKSAGTTGNGVMVQATNKTPVWLQDILGKNGVTNFYTDEKGNLMFKGGTGTTESYFTLATDSRGLSGLVQHMPDGTAKLIGGDYGFNPSVIQNMLNQASNTQQQIKVENMTQTAALQMLKPQALPSIAVTPTIKAPALSVSTAPPSLAAPQKTFNPQTTANPQKAAGGLQPTFNPQQTVSPGGLSVVSSSPGGGTLSVK